MNRIQIRVAALNEQIEQRLRFAARLLRTREIDASIEEWDGTRCDLLVTQSDDGYGKRAMAVAARRGTPILALTDDESTVGAGVHVLPMESPVISIIEAISGSVKRTPPKQENSSAGEATGLGLIASDARLAGRDLAARIADVTISLRRSAGRVLARNDAELAQASDALCTTGWSFNPLAPDGTEPQAFVSSSLDIFFLQGALHRKQDVPPFTKGRFRLDDWPDLGAAPELVNPMRIARRLIRGPATAEDVATTLGLDPAEVAACFWAFQASGVLKAANAESVVPQPESPEAKRPKAGLFRRLAERFGLAGPNE